MLGGRPMLQWSVDVLLAAPGIDEVIVALPAGFAAPAGCIGVAGGAERSHSVRAALAASSGDPVLVHDAARPLLTADLVEACLAPFRLADPGQADSGQAGSCHSDAVVAAASVTDTIKQASPDGLVTATLDRSSLWAVQTPQVFRRAALERVLAQDDAVLAAATDDASLIEADGGTVRIVPAPRENLKVTTPGDLHVAELALAARAAAPGAVSASASRDG